jgi:hypothetical protein
MNIIVRVASTPEQLTSKLYYQTFMEIAELVRDDTYLENLSLLNDEFRNPLYFTGNHYKFRIVYDKI